MTIRMHLRRPLAGLAAGAALLVTGSPHVLAASPTVAAAASAAEQQHLAAVKAEADAAVADRLAILEKHLATLQSGGFDHLTASDRAALTSEIQGEISGLTALRTTIDHDTTVKQALADARLIVTDYRVYVLEDPKLWLIRGADAQTAAEQELTTIAGELQTIAASSTSRRVAAAKAALADMRTQLGSAQALTAQVEPAVLPLTPAGYPGNAPALATALSQLRSAHGDLARARHDVDTILLDLS